MLLFRSFIVSAALVLSALFVFSSQIYAESLRGASAGAQQSRFKRETEREFRFKQSIQAQESLISTDSAEIAVEEYNDESMLDEVNPGSAQFDVEDVLESGSTLETPYLSDDDLMVDSDNEEFVDAVSIHHWEESGDGQKVIEDMGESEVVFQSKSEAVDSRSKLLAQLFGNREIETEDVSTVSSETVVEEEAPDRFAFLKKFFERSKDQAGPQEPIQVVQNEADVKSDDKDSMEASKPDDDAFSSQFAFEETDVQEEIDSEESESDNFAFIKNIFSVGQAAKQDGEDMEVVQADDTTEGDAQFMIEEMPLPAQPQIAQGPIEAVATPVLKEKASDQPGLRDRFASTWKRLFGDRKEDVEEAVEEALVTSDEEEGSAQFMVEQLPIPLPPSVQRPLPPVPVDILAPPVTTQQPVIVLPEPTEPVIAPTPPVIKPAIIAPKPPVTTAPVQAPAVISLPEPAAPAPAILPTTVAPKPVLPDFKPAPAPAVKLDLPMIRGLYMITPLEEEMWEAARNRDFEKAAEIRDRINKIMEEKKGFEQILKLERQMAAAAKELNFERAIEIREQIRGIQKEIILVPPPAVKFRVKGFRIKGNIGIPTNDLLTYTENLVDREITLADVRQAAVQIKSHYRRHGYIASYVYIPPQRLEDGFLEMQVIEGKLGKVTVKGNRYFSDKVLLNRFQIQPGSTIMYEMMRITAHRIDTADLKLLRRRQLIGSQLPGAV